MAFIDFDRVPNDSPVAVRAPVAIAVPVARPGARTARIAWPLLVAFAALLWIGQATAMAVDSPLLGFVAATLAFLIGVARWSAVQPGRSGRR